MKQVRPLNFDDLADFSVCEDLGFTERWMSEGDPNGRTACREGTIGLCCKRTDINATLASLRPLQNRPMQITVKLFARAKDLAGVGSFPFELPAGCPVGQAKTALMTRCPDLSPLMPILLIAVDGNYATDSTVLTESCELACFPPVSGG